MYPRIVDLGELIFPEQHPLGEIKSWKPVAQDTTRFLRQRDYNPVDPMKHIDWKASAKGTSLPLPFLVIATQNPIELEGTFPLPEAQLDRFLLRRDNQKGKEIGQSVPLGHDYGGAIHQPLRVGGHEFR